MVSEENSRTAFEQRSKALFDESVAELDGSIRSRLTQARHGALDGAETQRRYRVWLPLAGLATAAAMTAFVFVPGLRQQRTLPTSTASADDMTLLLNSEDLELLEDMEFYAWLDGDDVNART